MSKKQDDRRQEIEEKIRKLQHPIAWTAQLIVEGPINPEFGVRTGNFVYDICTIADHEEARQFAENNHLGLKPILAVTTRLQAEEVAALKRELDEIVKSTISRFSDSLYGTWYMA